MIIVDERFIKYLFSNLCRSGASWDLELGNKTKTFNEVKVTDERIIFIFKKNDLKDIQSDLKSENISELKAFKWGFTFSYKSPGREETKEAKIYNMQTRDK